MIEYMQVLTTVDSIEEAERLGRGITGAPSCMCSDRWTHPFPVLVARQARRCAGVAFAHKDDYGAP